MAETSSGHIFKEREEEVIDLETVILTLIIGVLAFAYVLAPLSGKSPRSSKSSRGAKRADDFGDVVAEEAQLELAAGKLEEGELTHLQSAEGEKTRAEAEDEIEREIRERRARLRGSV